MILRIVRTEIKDLVRDRGALLLTFALPIAFFSIFAVIFGSPGRQSTPKVHVIIVDEDHSETSQRMISALRQESALRVSTEPKADDANKDARQVMPPYTRAAAEKAVREGTAPVALVISKGFGNAPLTFGTQTGEKKVAMLCDTSDPIAPQMVSGLLQKAAMTAMPDVMASMGAKYIDEVARFTPKQKADVEERLNSLKKLTEGSEAKTQSGQGVASQADSIDFGGLIATDKRDVLGEKKKNPTIAFYAAAIGVMFLLFSASGAGGSLLDESETGALDRVLSTKVTMSKLIAGKLLFLTLMGTTQLTVMFVWAALVFKVELWSHLGGFFAMTLPTALASSAVGLLLASIARTRAQLGAISTLVILSMSALGGSMVPRFLMSKTIQNAGLITFNAWAIDGFQKVFWREEPISHLWPQVTVLLGIAFVLFSMARRFAKRWEVS